MSWLNGLGFGSGPEGGVSRTVRERRRYFNLENEAPYISYLFRPSNVYTVLSYGGGEKCRGVND